MDGLLGKGWRGINTTYEGRNSIVLRQRVAEWRTKFGESREMEELQIESVDPA